ncbi:hypothetical protein SAMN04487907_101256 [Zunongwangia mangrovi]|uniref:Uncharacterized protein n=1 Tax=Zunongwangia mangrovi TaxID=1334022 RepID=A0A1I1DCR0_9FLAO|nr:hypothetical protein [Zunongwangia mangrovi]SFB72156.1 hypothetical protein SAMN04487907_101256 [Zunongwangia mangrovi]
MARQLENTQLLFVDLNGANIQNPNIFYSVKLAEYLGGDGDSIRNKLCDINLTAFYCHDLPDWSKMNEAILKFNVKYYPSNDNNADLNEASFVRDFRVKDGTSPGGFLHRKIFKNVNYGEELFLKVKLDEIDEKFDISKVTGMIQNTSIGEYLNLGGALDYIKLGTEIYDGIAEMVVKDDPIWDEDDISLHSDFPQGGGSAALKEGTYILISTSDTKGKSTKYWEDDYSNVFYKGKHLHLGAEENDNHLKTNYMVFEIKFH